MTPTDIRFLYLNDEEQRTIKRWAKLAQKWFEKSFTEQVANYGGNSAESQRRAMAHYSVARHCFLEPVNEIGSVLSSRQEVKKQLTLISAWLTLTQDDLCEMRIMRPPTLPTLAM